MTLREIFKHNPFENQVAAGASTAQFPLRGHEDALEVLLRQVSSAIDYSDYPGTAQHTIVFGEWGHGKSHVLRTLESRINALTRKGLKRFSLSHLIPNPRGFSFHICEYYRLMRVHLPHLLTRTRKVSRESLFADG